MYFDSFVGESKYLTISLILKGNWPIGEDDTRSHTVKVMFSCGDILCLYRMSGMTYADTLQVES